VDVRRESVDSSAAAAQSPELSTSPEMVADSPTQVMAAAMAGTLARPPETVTLPATAPLTRRRMSAMAIMGYLFSPTEF